MTFSLLLSKNYYPQNIYPEIYEANTNWWDANISQPITDWFNKQLANIGDFIKVNLIEVIFVVSVSALIYAGIRLFFSTKKETEEYAFNIIYITISGFTIARLFWKVVFHV